jgi:D-glycero-D-manno-heptose 1,7-bisphosphate phosphatase
MSSKNRAVFLDRDGVINRAIVRSGRPFPPLSLAELEILPGVPEAIKLLHEAGLMLIVVTNQPDVARGVVQISTVEAINDYLSQSLPIDEFRTCYHDNDAGCSCRKPSPGSLITAAKLYNISLSDSFMVGDRWRDIEAGLRAGCETFFIDYGYNEKQPNNYNHRVQNLLEAAHIILKTKKNEKSGNA